MKKSLIGLFLIGILLIGCTKQECALNPIEQKENIAVQHNKIIEIAQKLEKDEDGQKYVNYFNNMAMIAVLSITDNKLSQIQYDIYNTYFNNTLEPVETDTYKCYKFEGDLYPDVADLIKNQDMITFIKSIGVFESDKGSKVNDIYIEVEEIDNFTTVIIHNILESGLDMIYGFTNI